MAEYLAPGVYVEEVPSGVRVIEGASTSVTAFVGVAERGPINQATLITSLTEYYAIFGRPRVQDIRDAYYLGTSVEGFFREGGTRCYVVRVANYTNIVDRTTLVAEAATLDFQNQDAVDALTVTASSEGAWGTDLRIQIRNSSKFGTTLRTPLPAGLATSIVVQDDGEIERGSMLWVVNPIVATVADPGSDSPALPPTLNRALAYFRDPSTTAVSVPTPGLPVGTLVLTPDFRYMARLNTALVLDAGPGANPAVLADTIAEGGLPDRDINGNRLIPGETLWFVEPSREFIRVVDRVDRNTNTVTFTASVTAPAMVAGTKVLARDFALRVIQNDVVEEVHEHLSPVSTNLRDFAESRINLGVTPSPRVRVAVSAENVPMQNYAVNDDAASGSVAATTLAVTSTDPDGLASLNQFDYAGNAASRTGLFALDDIDEVSILVVPYPRFDDTTEGNPAAKRALVTQVYNEATSYCEGRRYMFCVLDSAPAQDSVATLAFRNTLNASNYAAYYWPWIKVTPAGSLRQFDVPPAGAIAGIYANTDVKRGVHKAPAGTESGRVRSASGIERVVTKAEQDGLNRYGVNVIRSFASSGLNVWGARTISSVPEWRYVNVRRLMNFIEKSIDDGTQWVVFEPNNLALWKNIERNVGAFLRGVWRSGALFGDTEDMAFRVKCDAETNPSETIELGQVITEVKLAIVKPAEFVVFRIKQFAAGSTLEE